MLDEGDNWYIRCSFGESPAPLSCVPVGEPLVFSESSLLLWGMRGTGLGEGQSHFEPHVTVCCAQYLAEASAPGYLWKEEVGIYFSSECLPFLSRNLLNCPQTENSPLVRSDIGRVFICFVLSGVLQMYTIKKKKNPVHAFLFSSTGKLLYERLLREILSNNQSARAFMLVDHWRIGTCYWLKSIIHRY